MKNILPCPHCGGTAGINAIGYEADCFLVCCDNCHAKSAAYFNEDDAIEAWNKRTAITAKVETYTDNQQETWSVCECGTDVWKSYNYCPECGAKLDWRKDA